MSAYKKLVLVLYDKDKPDLQDTDAYQYIIQKVDNDRAIINIAGMTFNGVIFEGNLSEFVVEYSLSRLRW